MQQLCYQGIFINATVMSLSSWNWYICWPKWLLFTWRMFSLNLLQSFWLSCSKATCPNFSKSSHLWSFSFRLPARWSVFDHEVASWSNIPTSPSKQVSSGQAAHLDWSVAKLHKSTIAPFFHLLFVHSVCSSEGRTLGCYVLLVFGKVPKSRISLCF